MSEEAPEGAVVLETDLGRLVRGDSLDWLAGMPADSVRLVVADPPYGIGKAEWDTFASRKDYVSWARVWLDEISRILMADGTAYIMGYSEVLADLKWAAGDLFAGCRWLVWSYRNKGNMGADWGRSHESILHLRKSQRFTMNIDAVRVPYNAHTRRYPERTQGTSSQFGGVTAKGRGKAWSPHPLGAKPRDVIEVPVLNNGMAEKTPHPTQKPEELIRRLVAASSDPGDLVVDPFGGAGTTAVVCELLGRRWAVCEREAAYCDYASERLVAVAKGEHSLDSLASQEAARVANRERVRG
ncbi:MAG TPA: restriction endonuclease subunit M [Deltaproteobacteria bacterium]|nr:restriction endonuclease subunit M [Deltaproteobacteria bacterium]HCP47010.1 restriction endonuclease subunit M [Deltaproteobacteria bacterium]